MMAVPTDICWSSDRTLRVQLGDIADARAHARVMWVYERLGRASIPALADLTPAYTTLTLTFDAMNLNPDDAEALVRAVVAEEQLGASPTPGRPVQIPVCYEGTDLAPDLTDVAAMHALSAAEVVSLHSGAAYGVRFLGFSPGFAYLAGLPATLATPRLETPRVRVAAGSVGIAGDQTGVYPRPTPGGWRIIGRTPRVMFDPNRAEPSLLRTGDSVRFVPISRAEFDTLAAGPMP